MAPERHGRFTLGVAVVCLLVLGLAGPSAGQIFDDVTTTVAGGDGSSTTTTATPSTTAPAATKPERSTTTTTAAPPPPPDAPAGDGDGDDGGSTPRTVPPDAQRIIDSVQRSAPSSSQALYDAVQELVDLGMTPEEAIRIGFGRFPVAGVARYSHDWLYPRWGPGFRFHHGTDIVAPYGTPLRATVDGVATSRTSELGGLSVKVHMPDGTYFYYAHLSALVDGFSEGMPVKTGDIIGFIGDSGNARGGVPHLHLGIYSPAGEPTDPKPVLDQFLADAMAQLPQIVEQVKAQRQAEQATEKPAVRTPRSLLATSLLRPLTDRTAAGAVPTEVLYQASASPSGGLSMAEAEAEQFAASIDWDEIESRASVERRLIERTEALLRAALGPLAG